MDHVRLDPTGLQPAGQPEAVATGLECDSNPADGSSCSGRFVLPASEQVQKALLVWLKLLQGLAVNAWYDPGNEPIRPAHLDDCDNRAVLVQRKERSTQVIPLWHGALHRWFPATMVLRLAARPIASVMLGPVRVSGSGRAEFQDLAAGPWALATDYRSPCASLSRLWAVQIMAHSPRA